MPFDYKALRRDIELLIDQALSNEAQQAIFVAFAIEEKEEFVNAWREALADRNIDPEQFVDGVRGAALEEVDFPGGLVLLRIEPTGAALNRVLQLLAAFVKVKSGRYQRSLAIYSNDRRLKNGDGLESGDEVAVAYLAPYARKAERDAFNIRDGVVGAKGLLETVAGIAKNEFAGKAVSIRKNFANFSEAELAARDHKGEGPSEPSRLPAIFIS